jgi:sec-independent protein translocase protein TatB
MFNVGAGEMVIILVAALLVLGPSRLPEMARAIGKFMREFRRQTDDVRGMVEREFYKMDEEELRAPPSPDPTPLQDPDVARARAAVVAGPVLVPAPHAVARGEAPVEPPAPSASAAPPPVEVGAAVDPAAAAKPQGGG